MGNGIRLKAILILMIGLATQSSIAKYLSAQSGPCSDGVLNEWIYCLVQDDCTGRIVSFYYGCDGEWYWGRVCRADGVSLSGSNLILPVTVPTNFNSLVAQGDFLTPGGDQGLYMVDANSQMIRFRNPLGVSQADSLQGIWSAAQSCGQLSHLYQDWLWGSYSDGIKLDRCHLVPLDFFGRRT